MQIGAPALELTGQRDRRGAHLVGVPPRFEAEIDVQALVAARLRMSDDADLVEQRLHLARAFSDHLEVDPRCRVEVDAQLVGVVEVGGLRRPHVEAEAAQVHRPHDMGDVGDHERLRCRPVRGRHGRGGQPLGRALGHTLLEERLAAGAVGEPLQQHGTTAHRGHDGRLDGQVVLDQVELRVAAFLEEHLAGTRQRDLVAGQAEHDRAVVSRRFRLRVLGRGHARTLDPRRT